MNAENQNIEYKESWRDEYLKWICGFANAQGGKAKLHEPHASNARNKNIAFAFYKAGFIEAWGRGISKIVTQFTEAGLKEPKFEDFCGGVRVTIYRNTDLVAETIEKNNGEDVEKDVDRVVENVNGVVEKDVDRVVENTKIVQKNDGEVTENQKTILSEIEKNPLITAQQLSDILHISSRKIQKNMAILKSKGFIRRVGPDKGGHWKIVKKTDERVVENDR